MSILAIQSVLNSFSEKNVRLFFITKKNVQRNNARVSSYGTLSVDIDNDVRTQLWNIVKEKIDNSADSELSFEEYVIVADELQKRNFKHSPAW